MPVALRLLIGVAVTMVVLVGGLWLFQRRLIYFPTANVPPVERVLPGWENAAFETSDGLLLNGWFTAPSEGVPVVVVFTGNAGNRSDRASLGRGLANEGLGVMLFDYRGYGDNPGHPSDAGLARDARAAVEWSRLRAPGHEMVYFGESLGAAVAIELALAEPPAALVLRSPFSSLADLAALHSPLPVRGFLRDRYPSLDRVDSLSTSTLVIAGDSDSIVPINQSRAIYEAAPFPKELVIIAGADHNDLPLVSGPQVIEAVSRFVLG
jgi:fermentation-respiration switch protein FrsA (DUF1100 family)